MKILILILLINNFCIASPNYDDAIDKSKEALYIQSGVKSDVDKFTIWGENQGKYYLSVVGLDSAVGIIGFGYKTYKNQFIKFKYINNYYYIYKDQVKVEIPIL